MSGTILEKEVKAAMETDRKFIKGAQTAGRTDLPRIENMTTGYAVEPMGESKILANFQEDAIDANADREDLKRWAEHEI